MQLKGITLVEFDTKNRFFFSRGLMLPLELPEPHRMGPLV
jgi:hypothetical protein